MDAPLKTLELAQDATGAFHAAHCSPGQFQVLDLFSGIGGFALATEWAGGRTMAFCELSEYPARVLKARWPEIPNLGDVKGITRDLVDSIASLDDNPDMNDPKYAESVSLYRSGLSVAEVADYFGVTRQAMWKILLRRGCEMRPRVKREEENHFYRGGIRHDRRAIHLVEKAVKKGILIPQSCEVCGLGDAQAHHDDYSKPLVVRWLCKKHHHEWHKENKAKNGKENNLRTLPSGRIDVLTGGVP